MIYAPFESHTFEGGEEVSLSVVTVDLKNFDFSHVNGSESCDDLNSLDSSDSGITLENVSGF